MKSILAFMTTMALLTLLIMTPNTSATGCRTVYRQPTVVSYSTHVPAKVIKSNDVYPLAYPAYGAYYRPDHEAQAQNQKDQLMIELLQQLSKRLESMERQFGVLPSPAPGQGIPQAAPPAAPPMPPAGEGRLPGPEEIQGVVERLFSARCANCHSKPHAEAMGGGFTLLDNGRLAPLTARQAGRVVALTYSGEMPKGKTKLTDQEVNLVMVWFDSYIAAQQEAKR